MHAQNFSSIDFADRRFTTTLFAIFSVCMATVGSLSLPQAATAETESTDYIETPIDQFDRDHWSFRPIQPVEVPAAGDSNWCRNPIDNFVRHELNKRGLQPQPTASRRTIIRRLSFDLLGIPPTPAEISAFESDHREDAYDRLVGRLLQSPRYGERWAQHWLDLARFAETDGFEHDKVRPNAWQYRDWVITALNDDMPYDEFIRRQIAGDELYPDDESALIATRFCLSGPDMPDINLLEERRHTVLNELTSTVGEVFLGLQIGCAQCHDHKYDPVSQGDFYRLRAIFEPAIALKKNKSLSTLQESYPYTQSSHLMLRGDFRHPGPEVVPGVIRVVSSESNTFSPDASGGTAGLRTALANWLAAPQNPLTARVMVNRVWQHHFGVGLSDTPSEFGVMGSEPSHPQLLDWLSKRFIEQGWSLKSLHRLIVTSATYRQRSRLDAHANQSERLAWTAALKEDPQAHLLSRYPRWRLEGEAIRDAILVSSGQINLKTGGPGIRPPLPKELIGTLLKNQWNVTEDSSEHRRRSIYVFARRNLRYPIFEVFDRPSANSSCSSRGVSTTAPQSLHLLNSQFTLDMSRRMANSIIREHTATESQIEQAFLRSLGRAPEAEERDFVQTFFDSGSEHSDSEHSGSENSNNDSKSEQLAHLCLSLFNCNEFIFVD